jgi:uncharacterized protein (DUF58 family)
VPSDREPLAAAPDLAAEVDRCAHSYRLKLPRAPLAGPAGRSAGADVGASLDFQDFRAYFPGDDVRHVDWSVYARSDNLVVRLYREEVSPDVEVVLDCSRSMASSALKAAYAVALTRLFLSLAERERGGAALVLADDNPRRLRRADVDRALDAGVFTGVSTLHDALASGGVSLRKRSVRVVVSDFLFPHAAADLVARLARQAAALYVVQALDPSEIDPDFPGGRLLVDVETLEEANVVVNDAAIARYRGRLDALSAELARQCRLWAAPFARAGAGALASCCRDVFLPAGIVEAV